MCDLINKQIKQYEGEFIMNFIKTATAVAGGIVLAQVAKDVFGKLLNGLNSMTRGKDSGNDDPKPTKPAK